jgi:hypothetical protein
MPVNREKKLIFIHIPKAGGTSIEKYFGLKEFYTEEPRIPSPQHMTARQLKITLNDDALWGESFKFTMTRNPYTRMLSEYCWRYGDRYDGEKYYNFYEFLKEVSVIVREKRFYEAFRHDHFIPQVEFVAGEKLDYIGKIEAFDECMKKISQWVGITVTDKPQRLNKSQTKHKTDLLDFKCRRLIYRIYKDDFKFFGYQR